MFRIQENLDGTTSIYCKNTGDLLCTVPSKGNASVPRRVNVVEPQPANVSTHDSSWHLLKKQGSYPINNEPPALHTDEKDVIPITRESQCCLSPIPIFLDRDQIEDYSNASVTQENFAKCLNLVSTERLKSAPRDALLAEFPLRLLSRSRAYRTSEPLRDIKVPDQLPLTSYLGVRVLRLNEGRSFVGAERVAVSLRAYEAFCRHPYNTVNPASCHFPKLRCREKKQYPVVSSTRVLRHPPYTHCYVYGRRQREERKITLATGLNTRSRRLLRLCNAKRCTIDIKRLPEEEILDWLSRRSATPPPSSDSESDEDSDPVYIPTSRVGVSQRGTASTRNRRRRCVVYLRNVLMDIQRLNGSHYVKGTHIRVPFYKDFLSSLRTNRPLLNAIYVANTTGPGPGDHAYSQSTATTSRFKALLLPSGKQRQTTQKSKPKTSYMSKVWSDSKEPSYRPKVVLPSLGSSGKMGPPGVCSNKTKAIDVIDLTGETTPPRETPVPRGKRLVPKDGGMVVSGRKSGQSTDCGKQVAKGSGLLPPGPSVGRPTKDSGLISERFLVSRWKFLCFGCGFQRLYFEQEQPQAVERAVRDHMHSYHFVSDAEAFLSRYLDSVNHCTVIEAFPGFKGSFDD